MFKYFKGKVSQGYISLYSGRMVLRVSDALLSLFIPIFLYKLFNFDIKYVVYYYIAGHMLYALTVAWGAKYLNKIGLRRSLRISIVFGIVYYIIFYFLDKYSESSTFSFSYNNSIFLLIIAVIVVITITRIMWWIPVHTDMAKFTSKRNRGKQLSFIEASTIALGAFGPIFAGWILSGHSYEILFIIAIIIYLISFIPLASLPRTEERFSWTYWQTWKEYFSRKRRRAIIAFMGNGAEDVVGIAIWPIFIWELLEGNYFQVGALTSLIVVITVGLQLLTGRFADLFSKGKMIKYGSIFYAIGWVAKIFIATAFQIFIASTFHNFTKIFTRTPFDTLYYERAADQGHYVDEYTVIHEMAIQFGKVLMLILILILLPYFSIQWTFILAAMASLAMNFLVDKEIITTGRHAG